MAVINDQGYKTYGNFDTKPVAISIQNRQQV